MRRFLLPLFIVLLLNTSALFADITIQGTVAQTPPDGPIPQDIKVFVTRNDTTDIAFARQVGVLDHSNSDTQTISVDSSQIPSDYGNLVSIAIYVPSGPAGGFNMVQCVDNVNRDNGVAKIEAVFSDCVNLA